MSLARLSRPKLAARRHAERALADYIGELVGRPVGVRLTRNRTILLRLRRVQGRDELRMHLALGTAAPEELRVIAAWVDGKPGSRQAARTLVERYQGRIDEISPPLPRAAARAAIAGAGRGHHHHDLVAIVSALKVAYFPALGDTYVAWSGRIGRSRRRRLGWWNPRTRLISIHQCLDRAEVPRFFVESIVFHELCHAACDPSRTPTGKRRWHGPEFRALERRFPHVERALEWERQHSRIIMGRA